MDRWYIPLAVAGPVVVLAGICVAIAIGGWIHWALSNNPWGGSNQGGE